MRNAILLSMAVVAFSANCANHFTLGTRWKTIDLSASEQASSVRNFWLETPEDGSEQGLCMLSASEADPSGHTLEGYVRADGEKVFYRPAGASGWYLLYDFGMQIGDVCEVYSGTADAASVEASKKYVNYWNETGTNSEMGNWDAMRCLVMQSTDWSEDSDDVETVTWIKGIGSEAGPLRNIAASDNSNIRLFQVWSDSRVIYSAAFGGVADAEMSAPCRVEVDGLNISVTGSTGERCGVYTPAGVLIESFILDGNAALTLPQPGIYILRLGSETRKIIAR